VTVAGPMAAVAAAMHVDAMTAVVTAAMMAAAVMTAAMMAAAVMTTTVMAAAVMTTAMVPAAVMTAAVPAAMTTAVALRHRDPRDRKRCRHCRDVRQFPNHLPILRH
jgi:glucan phosphoethanolaminetransferase (alkaline phosphatase superfamily)